MAILVLPQRYGEVWLGQAVGWDGAAVEAVQSDWLTVNGYLGSDGVDPMLPEDGSHGVFVLVKTSNPSSGELQDSPVVTASHDGDGTTGTSMGPVLPWCMWYESYWCRSRSNLA